MRFKTPSPQLTGPTPRPTPSPPGSHPASPTPLHKDMRPRWPSPETPTLHLDRRRFGAGSRTTSRSPDRGASRRTASKSPGRTATSVRGSSRTHTLMIRLERAMQVLRAEMREGTSPKSTAFKRKHEDLRGAISKVEQHLSFEDDGSEFLGTGIQGRLWTPWNLNLGIQNSLGLKSSMISRNSLRQEA